MVIMVITANTVFPSGLSQVGANRAGDGGGGNQNERWNRSECKHALSPSAHLHTQTVLTLSPDLQQYALCVEEHPVASLHSETWW